LKPAGVRGPLRPRADFVPVGCNTLWHGDGGSGSRHSPASPTANAAKRAPGQRVRRALRTPGATASITPSAQRVGVTGVGGVRKVENRPGPPQNQPRLPSPTRGRGCAERLASCHHAPPVLGKERWPTVMSQAEAQSQDPAGPSSAGRATTTSPIRPRRRKALTRGPGRAGTPGNHRILSCRSEWWWTQKSTKLSRGGAPILSVVATPKTSQPTTPPREAADRPEAVVAKNGQPFTSGLGSKSYPIYKLLSRYPMVRRPTFLPHAQGQPTRTTVHLRLSGPGLLLGDYRQV
jgi:hypothetical protein